MLNNESGAGVVLALLGDPDNEIFIHALNAAEVFYQVSRASDVLTVRTILNRFFARGFVETLMMDTAFREDLAQLKADWRRVSLADCAGIALARRLSAEFVTGDHHELDVLDAAKVAILRFFR